MKKHSTRRGFTLIELLVVVLIIGILAAIALPQYQKAVMKARMTQAISFNNAIEKAMQLYVLEHGWPASAADEVDFFGKKSNATLDIDIQLPICTQDYSCEDKYFSYNVNSYFDSDGETTGLYSNIQSLDDSNDRIKHNFLPPGVFTYECYGMSDEGYKMCEALDSLQPNTWTIYD